MKGEDAYACWTPDDSPWSVWVKPVLFAQMDGLAAGHDEPAADAPWAPAPEEIAATPAPSGGYRDAAMIAGVVRTALIVDLPGLASAGAALALARRGFRPVPLFNACIGPAALLEIEPVARRVRADAPFLRELALPADAPPAFLLDADRLAGRPSHGRFDNRWMVLPQDFPSGRFLRERGVGRAVVASASARPPGEDLAHVLRRWQELGIEILLSDISSADPPRRTEIARPSRFGGLAYRALAVLGLRRNSAGGFGSMIPTPSAGGGGFG